MTDIVKLKVEEVKAKKQNLNPENAFIYKIYIFINNLVKIKIFIFKFFYIFLKKLLLLLKL